MTQDHIAVEEFVTHPHPYGYAGTPDLVAPFHGKVSIVDWTTSNRQKVKAWVKKKFLQTTAYALAWQEKGIDVTQAVVVVLTRSLPSSPHSKPDGYKVLNCNGL